MKLRILLTALACLFVTQKLYAQQPQKPNLLFIITDQQQYKALQIAGNSVLKTPNLDSLARSGAYFKNAYTPCPVCAPGRASVLTGYSVENTGMKTNGHAYNFTGPGIMTMPTFDEVLSQEGYRCEYYGKWHSQTSHAQIYQNPVLSASNGQSIFGPGGQTHIYRDYLKINETPRTPQNGEFKELISRWPYVSDTIDKYHGMTIAQLAAQNKSHSQPDQHGKLLIDTENSITAFQAKQTIEAIERLKDSTFAITCSFHFPHAPMTPCEPYYSMYPPEDMVPPVSIDDIMWESPYQNTNGRGTHTEYADSNKIKFMISNYYGLITEIDDWVGKILDKLDEHNLTENTLIIFTSDHGEMLGAHGMREKNVFYEESAHIPLFIRYPNEIDSQITVDGYVSLVDIFPTILDYLGVGPQPSDGISLRGLIEKTDTVNGKYVVSEWDYRGDSESNFMIVKDGWKLIIPYTTTSSVLNTLYDLNTDPHEMDNLLGFFPNRAYYHKVEELRACLLDWLAKTGSEHYQGVKDRAILHPPTPIDPETLIPAGFHLDQNYPNPFSHSTTIRYGVPHTSHLQLSVINALGQQIAELVNQQVNAGTYQMNWDASNLPGGIYTLVLKSDKTILTKQLILSK